MFAALPAFDHHIDVGVVDTGVALIGDAALFLARLGDAVLVAVDEGRGAEYVKAIYGAIWGAPVDLSQRPVLIGVLDRADFGSSLLLERANSVEYISKLEENTNAAAKRGVFGSPTVFVGEEMFFGNDRLDFVAEAVRAAAKQSAHST